MVVLWLASAFVLGLGFRGIGLPPLVGFLVAGFVLRGLGVEKDLLIEELAHAGVLLLLFSVGLKVRLKNIVQAEVWAGASIHLVVTVAVIGLGLLGAFALDWTRALTLGAALAFSSTVVAAKILEEKRELRAFHARVAIGILVVQDLVAVGILAGLASRVPSAWSVLLLGLPLLRPLLSRLLDYAGHGELLVVLGVLLALGLGGYGFQSAGLSPELGALVTGALLANHPRAEELSRALWSLKEIFLVAFFLEIGMSGAPTLPALGFAMLMMVVLAGKATLFFFVLLRFRLRARTSFLTALSLASYSEFGLIVVHLAVNQGAIPPHWLTYVAVTVALSFALAAPLNRAAHGLFERFGERMESLEADERHPDDEPISLGRADIAILGMGRVGSGAYDSLRAKGQRVIGLDSDPGKIEHHRRDGRRVLYADAEDSGFWQRLNLSGVSAVLLAMPDLEAKLISIDQLRRRGFTGLISATNVYPEEAEQILAHGCTTTFNYFEEAGVGFAQHTWESLHPMDPEMRPGEQTLPA